MTERSEDAKTRAAREEREALEAAEAERKLGRALAFGLPAASVVVAWVVGAITSAGPAILVLVAGSLLGAIALLWGSLRTLGGDAPLSHELEAVAARGGAHSSLAERKQKALRALKDIEHEHSIGKIDDDDFADLKAKYREEAKGVLRELDVEIEPYREKAEALAKKHLAKVGLGAPDVSDGAEKEASVTEASEPEASETPAAREPRSDAKVSCAKCKTANDEDAAFCKKCGASLGKSGEGEETARAD
jgi:hypothetical protein